MAFVAMCVLLGGCVAPQPRPTAPGWPLHVAVARHLGDMSLMALLTGRLVAEDGCLFISVESYR